MNKRMKELMKNKEVVAYGKDAFDTFLEIGEDGAVSTDGYSVMDIDGEEYKLIEEKYFMPYEDFEFLNARDIEIDFSDYVLVKYA